MPRPRIGGTTSVALGDGLLAWIDEYAAMRGANRATAIRGLLVDAYAAHHRITHAEAIRAILARQQEATR